MTSHAPTANPLLADWATPDGVPPFDVIKPEHFRPAYTRALAENEEEIAAIKADPAPASFDNTIGALELSGRALTRVESIFHMLVSAHANDALLAIEREIVPLTALHWNKISTDTVLFARVNALMQQADGLGLTAEQARVLERHHTSFRRSGAALDDAAKERLAEIIERLAALGTPFSENALADEQAFTLRHEGEAELAGLPHFMREVLRATPGSDGVHGYASRRRDPASSRSCNSPTRRDLREKCFRGFINARRQWRCRPTIRRSLPRPGGCARERANFSAVPDFAHGRLDDAMAITPAAVRHLLDAVWAPARVRALADRDAMQALIHEEGGNFNSSPGTGAITRKSCGIGLCDFDEAAIKPYFNLDRMIEAAFYTAGACSA